MRLATLFSLLAIVWLISLTPLAIGSHQEHEAHSFEETSATIGPGH